MLRSILRNKNSVSLLSQGRPLVGFNKRFSSYPWFQSMAENIPKENPRIADETLEETEVITRILYVMKNFNIYDLEKFKWDVRLTFPLM